MATSKEYLSYISDMLSGIDGITHKQMMGEYIIYLRGKIAAYLCDNRLLVKIVPAALGKMPTAKKESPYAGASEILRVNEEDISEEFLKELFEAMYPELPEPKKKKK